MKTKDSMGDLFIKFFESQGLKFVDATMVKPGGESGVIRTMKMPVVKSKKKLST